MAVTNRFAFGLAACALALGLAGGYFGKGCADRTPAGYVDFGDGGSRRVVEGLANQDNVYFVEPDSDVIRGCPKDNVLARVNLVDHSTEVMCAPTSLRTGAKCAERTTCDVDPKAGDQK